MERIFALQAEAGRLRSRAWLRPAAGVALTLVIGSAGLTAWLFVSRARSERELTATVSRVERLVDAGRFVEVWRAAGEGLRRWPNDTRLQQALQASTHVGTIATQPPGAEVMFKAYTDVDSEWIPLGTTPLNGVRAPLGMLRWKVAKPSYEPVEARLEVGVPAAAAGRPDVAARPIRLHRPGEGVPGAVLVPGGQSVGFRSVERRTGVVAHEANTDASDEAVSLMQRNPHGHEPA